MWTIDLERIQEEGVSIERCFDAMESLDDCPDLSEFEGTCVSLELRPSGQGRFHLEGHLTGRARAVCDRCTEAFRYDFDRSFTLELEPTVEMKEAVITPENANVWHYLDSTLDVEQVMAEQLNLSLPMKLLCSEECRGLCTHCGTNRNRSGCDCQADETDARFASLREFIVK